MFNFIFAPEIPRGDRELLQASFLEVWNSLPMEARASMTANWNRADGPKVVAICFESTIEGQPSTVSGICSTFGDELRYRYPRIIAMPTHIRRILIAHELAHSYDWSKQSSFDEIKAAVGLQFKGGWFDYATRRGVWLDARPRQHEIEFDGFLLFSQAALDEMDKSIEYHARQVNQSWGFDEEALQAWLVANVKASNI